MAVLFALLALVLSYAAHALLRPRPFADRAVATLREPAVQREVADRLSDAIIQSGKGDLATVRPLVRSVAGSIVASGAFAALFRQAVLNAHRAVIEHDSSTIHLNLVDAGVLVQAALERIDPADARRIGAERTAELLTLRGDGALLSIFRAAERARSAAWLLLLLSLLAASGAIWISPDRRGTSWRLGLGLVVGAMTLILLLAIGLRLVEDAAAPGRAAFLGAIWRAFLGGLRTQALWLAGAGAILAGAASGRLRPVRIDATLLRGWRLLTRAQPTRPRRVARAAGLSAVGIVIVLEPVTALTIGAQAIGLYLLYRGVEALLRETAPATPPTRVGVRLRAPRLGRLRDAAPRLVAVAAAVGILVLLASGAADEAPALTPLTCNGHVELCGRHLNDVALAATHNSMGSVTIPSFLFGQQDGTISEQLDDGVRGLLIDTYHGLAVPGGVQTELGRSDGAKRELVEREIGAPAVDAALRIRSRLGYTGKGKPGIFLCHAFCELGAVPFASALSDLRTFLVSNPGEVVVVINQDEGVTPVEVERAFANAGLLDLVYRGPLGPFPTLREMIDSNQRLVVMAENEEDSAVPWYHLAYQHALQETPFGFRSTAALTDPSQLAKSCSPNRGPASAPLFLLNHWVDTPPTPRASLASIVNAREALLTRAQTCERIRKQIPNLVAVDFYRRGDLLGVVDALNGFTK